MMPAHAAQHLQKAGTLQLKSAACPCPRRVRASQHAKPTLPGLCRVAAPSAHSPARNGTNGSGSYPVNGVGGAGVRMQLAPREGDAAGHAAADGAVHKPKYKRVLLKVSGEALQGSQGFGMDPSVLEAVAREVARAHAAGVQVAIVVGGGNYFRGASAWSGLERATADYVGMLATCMNALCLQAALENEGVPTRVQTAIEMREVAEPYIRRRAVRHLEKNTVVIFGAGTGNPYFTTDTAASLRAAEINAEVMLKATKVDGVYDCDPTKNPDARRYSRLSFREVALQQLGVMDETAVTLCKENDIPVIVFNALEPGNILKACLGEPVGTVVNAGGDGEEESYAS